MTLALRALLTGEDPYALSASPISLAATATATSNPPPASWKRWLDLVDELAMLPGRDSPELASDLLLQYKVTSDAALLDQRTSARLAYHALADSVDWTVPAAIRQPLGAWNFAGAQSALDVASYAWTATGQTAQTLPAVDARSGPVMAAWEAADTAQDLVAANMLAQTQLLAAGDVADAIAVAEAPRDVVTTIGLLGSAVPEAEPAVAAVRTIDAETAASISASIRATLTEAASAGRVRIGLAIGATLVVLVMAAVVVLRQRRGQRGRLAAPNSAPALEPHASPLPSTPTPVESESTTAPDGADTLSALPEAEISPHPRN